MSDYVSLSFLDIVNKLQPICLKNFTSKTHSDISRHQPYGYLISDKLKWECFQHVAMSALLYDSLTLIPTKCWEKSDKDAICCFKHLWMSEIHIKLIGILT